MFRKVRVKTLFPSLILVAAAVASATANPDVMESSRRYSCCKPALEFDQQCENTWAINNQPIAYFKDEERHCIPPCKKIEDGVMTLEACVDVNTTIVCTNEKKVTMEKRIHFSAQPCNGSLSDKMAPGNQGFVALLLLGVLIGGLLVSQMTS